jgi:drug/metabolite transporter (DMT)-like permease
LKRGIFFGLVSAAGQGFGTVISSVGMSASGGAALNPVSAALIRMLFAGAFLWTGILIVGKASQAWNALKDREGIRYAAAGAIVGPFIGMTLSMVAIQEIQVGIAQTLMSLMPVFIIPFMWIFYREKTDWHGTLGALIAVLGVAILCLTYP